MTAGDEPDKAAGKADQGGSASARIRERWRTHRLRPEPRWPMAAAVVAGRLEATVDLPGEQAARLQEAGTASEVVFLTVGPAKAVDGLRKALAIGGDSAVHVTDAAMHGSDALATSLCLFIVKQR